MDYVIKRLQEPSTWRGIVAFISGLGVTLTPEYKEAIIGAGLGVMGLIGMLSRDKK